jgi:hypothetical protein
MLNAIEKRYQDQQHQSIKNLDSLKRWNEISTERIELEREQVINGSSKFPGLQWTMNN